jgi:hypothetical protein
MSTQQKSMTTQEVANRLVSLCREGKVLDAGEELYGENIISHESPPAPNLLASGKAAVRAKGNEFAEMIEAHHGGKIGDPQVAGNYFTLAWTMDVTMKGQGRSTMEEIAVYKVQDGKIVEEWFHY